MAKLHHVKKARKDNPRTGVKKGQEYWYQWRRTNQKVRATKTVYLTKPKPSQLVSSGFMQEVLAIEESLAGCDSPDAIRDAAERLREVGRECAEKADNMPDSLRDSPTAELLRERAERCEDIATELENAANAVENAEIGHGIIEDELADVSWDFPG